MLKLHDLRQCVGMVSQEIQLFHASVRDNVAVFDRSIVDERIIQALEELGLGNWYHALPQGLDTELAPGGGGLSGGEAQLLAFSRLDPATEHQLEQAIDRLLKGRTAIIIAHRLATVQRAGRILIIEDGAVCEQGSREALAADANSRFAHLLRTGLEEVLA
jgi:ABC-type multidrug transport system fused ATPase/permease subunit